jgi:hypothetical protein
VIKKKNYAKNKMQDEKKIDLWKDLNDKYKEYMINRDELWNNTHDELIHYLKNKKKNQAVYQKMH